MKRDLGKGKTSKGEKATGTFQQMAKDGTVSVHNTLSPSERAGRGCGIGSRKDSTKWSMRGREGSDSEGLYQG